jgi:hypothetical protein
MFKDKFPLYQSVQTFFLSFCETFFSRNDVRYRICITLKDALRTGKHPSLFGMTVALIRVLFPQFRSLWVGPNPDASFRRCCFRLPETPDNSDRLKDSLLTLARIDTTELLCDRSKSVVYVWRADMVGVRCSVLCCYKKK